MLAKLWKGSRVLNAITNEIVNDINTMLCPIKVKSNTIELTVHTSCYCVWDLLCVTYYMFNVLRGNQRVLHWGLGVP